MVVIYHNPKCSKSREGLKFIQERTQNIKVIDYIKSGIDKQELKNIINLLNISPIKLVRTNESIWKENYKNKQLNDEEILIAMVENPKLIQRPIIINNNKAIIGRPTECINDIL